MWVPYKEEHAVTSNTIIKTAENNQYPNRANLLILEKKVNDCFKEEKTYAKNRTTPAFQIPSALEVSKHYTHCSSPATSPILNNKSSTQSTSTEQILSRLKFSDIKSTLSTPLQQETRIKEKHTSSSAAEHFPAKNNKLITKKWLLLLAVIYLLGVFLAGTLYNHFTEAELNYLACYLKDCHHTLQMQHLIVWVEQCISSTTNLTLLFVLGLFALGSPLIPVVLFCKGIANGMLLLKCYEENRTQGVWHYIWTFGITEAILVTCMCLLGVASMINAARMFRYIFYCNQSIREKETQNHFSRKYCLTILVMMIVYACNLMIGKDFTTILPHL